MTTTCESCRVGAVGLSQGDSEGFCQRSRSFIQEASAGECEPFKIRPSRFRSDARCKILVRSSHSWASSPPSPPLLYLSRWSIRQMALGDVTLSPCCPAALCILHVSFLLHQSMISFPSSRETYHLWHFGRPIGKHVSSSFQTIWNVFVFFSSGECIGTSWSSGRTASSWRSSSSPSCPSSPNRSVRPPPRTTNSLFARSH